MYMATEKKVEVQVYTKFQKLLEAAFKECSIESYFGTDDYPDFIKTRLAKASKSKKQNKKKGRGIPDAIFNIKNQLSQYIFVFEAKGKNIKKAKEESIYYCDYLKDTTTNLFRCGIDKDHIVISHHILDKELRCINTLADIDALIINPKKFLNELLSHQNVNEKEDEGAKEKLLSIIRNLNKTLREVGLSGQDRIDFASSLFLLKEIYDLVDDDFRRQHFSQILYSTSLHETIKSINQIATLNKIRSIFPDFSHLIIDNQLINIEKFNKVIPKDDTENNIKAQTAGKNLNDKIKDLLQNDVINLSKADFDFRGSIVEEFTHGNKGGGVSKEYGEFFTPRHIIRFATNLSNLKSGDKVFDPSFGTGGFLIEAFKQLVKLNNGVVDENLKKHTIYGVELHEWNVKAAKASLIALGDGHSNLINTDFINGFVHWDIDKQISEKGNSFYPDVVLMNPPYSLGGESSEWHFVKKCFDQQIRATAIDNKERTLVAILPYEEIVDETSFLNRYSKYLDAYISLPYGVFLKYTSVRTQIVILKTKEKYLSDTYEEPTFVAKVESDGYSLDNFRRPIIENDIPEIIQSYNDYQLLKFQVRDVLDELSKIEDIDFKDKIHSQEKFTKKIFLENELDATFNKFKNSTKFSLLKFKNYVRKYSHFDKALWFYNCTYPTLGSMNPQNKLLGDYFDVVETNVLFSNSKYEDLPYIEIGNIELISGFYQESEKQKCLDSKSENKGEIKGGTLAQKGDILISMVRSYRGAFAVVKEDSVVSKTGFLVLRPKKFENKGNQINSTELFCMLKIELSKLTKYINYVGSGKTYPKMEKNDFLKIYIDKKFAPVAKKSFYMKLIEQIDVIFK